jgi:hypothetical protein
MGYGGVDLEEPYQAVSGAADDEAAAPPFLGKAPPPAGIHLRLSLCEKVCMTLVVASLFLLAIAAPIWGIYLEKARAPTFTVLLSSLQGIDLARPARVVSPAFNLTLGMNRTCADRADVAVSYAGAALGWARVAPHDCAADERPGTAGSEVAVVAVGQGVGLSREVRERMAEEWQRTGTVELDVEVAVYDDGPHLLFSGPDVRGKVVLCKLRTDGRQPSESPRCSWYSLIYYTTWFS